MAELFNHPDVDIPCGLSGEYVVVAYHSESTTMSGVRTSSLRLNAGDSLNDFLNDVRGSRSIGALSIAQTCRASEHIETAKKPKQQGLQTERVLSAVYVDKATELLLVDWLPAVRYRDASGVSTEHLPTADFFIRSTLFLPQAAYPTTPVGSPQSLVRARGIYPKSPLFVAVTSLTEIIRPDQTNIQR